MLDFLSKIHKVADPGTKKYFEKIALRAQEQFELASKARENGFDPEPFVETFPAADVADRAEQIIGPKGVAKRYREVLIEMKGNRLASLFQIVKEIIEEKWCSIPDEQKRVEQALKTGLVLMTEGVVVSPIDGMPYVNISKNFDGSKYIDVYFAGPIRAAGGSATVLPLILGDYARKLMNLDRYKPTEDEVARYLEEIGIYQDDTARQYKLSKKEIDTIVRGCPVCINGVPTEEKEVQVHRDLERMPTNRVRGGMCLVISEGLALKAMKVLKWSKELNLDWSWLEKIIKVEKTQDKITELKPNPKFLDGLAAGRPIFSYPSEWGGLRIRYGRSRNMGIMGKAINPALMIMLDEFIAVGTHSRIERPGKAAQLFPCDTIDGPIVRLKNGDMVQLNSLEDAKKVKANVERIFFLGDLLVSLGDFRKTAHPLVPSGFVEEWWNQILIEKNNFKSEEIPTFNTFDEAFNFSKKNNVPLHPKYIWYYSGLTKESAKIIVNAVKNSVFENNNLILNNESTLKKALEKIGVSHLLREDKIILEGEIAKAIAKTFGKGNDNAILQIEEDILKSLTKISGVGIKNKAGTFIGGRMGRPEAAKPREMKGNPHVLFPISLTGGATRSINKAMQFDDKKSTKSGNIEVEIATYKDLDTGELTFTPFSKESNKRTKKVSVCSTCGRINEGEKCRFDGAYLKSYNERKINIQEITEQALSNLKVRMPTIVKGVKGLISEAKVPESIEKGILRAKNDIHVFRDGTSRFEVLNAPITHFKPREINLSVEKVKELGYSVDMNGKPIENSEQIITIFPQDVIINEGGGTWLVKVASFIDDLLERFYKLPRYYNAVKKEDMIGELVVGLAPHTSAGIIGRVLGYSKTRLGWGHPYFVTAKRRNVDGDQDSIMLLMDGLLNFSRRYLSEKSGGRMDTPLVFTISLNPSEVDDEVHEMETVDHYPLSLYEKSQEYFPPFLDEVEVINKILGKEIQYTGVKFTHETTTFDAGPTQSMYTQLTTMEDKIRKQANVQLRINAVKGKDSIERVLGSHFFPDIIGNARAFSRQKFRCTKCNAKYRRIPLRGVCKKCGNNLTLTIAEGSVRKYLEIAKQMINEYELNEYMKQRIMIVESEIDSVFKNEKVKQKSLFEFV